MSPKPKGATGKGSDVDRAKRPGLAPRPTRDEPQWTFLSNHAHVLLLLAQDPTIRLRDVAAFKPGAKVIMYKRPYGYSGSLYASQDLPPMQAGAINLPVPESVALPNGFYYLWQP